MRMILLAYIDDIVLLADSEAKHQKSLAILENGQERYVCALMLLRIKLLLWFISGKLTSNLKLLVFGNLVPKVQTYKYMGVTSVLTGHGLRWSMLWNRSATPAPWNWCDGAERTILHVMFLPGYGASMSNMVLFGACGCPFCLCHKQRCWTGPSVWLEDDYLVFPRWAQCRLYVLNWVGRCFRPCMKNYNSVFWDGCDIWIRQL